MARGLRVFEPSARGGARAAWWPDCPSEAWLEARGMAGLSVFDLGDSGIAGACGAAGSEDYKKSRLCTSFEPRAETSGFLTSVFVQVDRASMRTRCSKEVQSRDFLQNKPPRRGNMGTVEGRELAYSPKSSSLARAMRQPSSSGSVWRMTATRASVSASSASSSSHP